MAGVGVSRITLPILYYHRVDRGLHPSKGVSPGSFSRQMAWLRRMGYQSVRFDDLAAYFEDRARLPRKPVIITFDDGYEDNYRQAYPILRHFGFTATIFLVTDLIGQTSSWIDNPEEVLPLMNLEQVREMQSEGFSFGSHTCGHSCLVEVTDEKARDEIFRSKQDLENLLQEEVTSFCYPFGDYSDAVVGMVREAGYRAARVVDTDNRHGRSDLPALRCVKVNGYVPFTKFAFYLTRWYHWEVVLQERRRKTAQ